MRAAVSTEMRSFIGASLLDGDIEVDENMSASACSATSNTEHDPHPVDLLREVSGHGGSGRLENSDLVHVSFLSVVLVAESVADSLSQCHLGFAGVADPGHFPMVDDGDVVFGDIETGQQFSHAVDLPCPA